ncbi:MAG: HDOD domain-containing protein [Candidatus Kapabacteria bacterium]|jgi:putative nucleotidyltransferase with HDIG domain|nr:HDOD domain-containing protein [Candidatus Kapabacteria bacterium]
MAIIDALKRSQELASLPHIASKVLNLIQNKKVDLSEIARVIESDPILSMKLIRVANSPIFATRTKITSINHALMLLGTKRISNIVLSVSIYSKFFTNTHKGAAVLMERFFNHSYLTGNTSKTFAAYLNMNFNDNEFIGGLLHDIGKMAMLQVHPREYSLVQKLIREEGLYDLEAEKEVFGENHIEVGIQVAQLWKLPEEIVMIIAFYRNPSVTDEYKELIATVGFCDYFCKVRANRLVKSDDDEIVFDKLESWRVLCQINPDFKTYNQKEISLAIDDTIRLAPESLSSFK